MGLACAAALSRRGRSVWILERHDAIARETTSRNSQVIHAGIYYPRGSLKGRACVDGRRQLYAFCEAHGVPHRRVGKLVVATHASQLPALDALREKAEACGVTGDDERLRPLNAADVATLEPEVRCVGGVLSPSTGIVDAHELMLALQGEAEASGATVACAGAVERAEALPGGGVAIEAGGMALHYVNDDDTVQACAEEMWRLRIGSVVAKNAATGDIAGIVTERDFVKALATEVQPGTRAVSETLATAGEAMLFTTLVLSTGFAIYTFSSMPVLTNFGLLTAAAIALALVADVLLAPALMTWLVEESR